jgi:hypothetical protein
VAIALCISGTTLAAEAASSYPILAIPRTAGADALLKYELTPRERVLFKEIDAKTTALPSDATSAQFRTVAAQVGRRFGLTPEQSYAFFVRATFSEFEH